MVPPSWLRYSCGQSLWSPFGAKLVCMSACTSHDAVAGIGTSTPRNTFCASSGLTARYTAPSDTVDTGNAMSLQVVPPSTLCRSTAPDPLSAYSYITCGSLCATIGVPG